MLSDLPSRLAAAWPPERWRDVTVLVAASGGADSVALVCALAELSQNGEGRLVIAHFNHHLRGVDSDGDQAFVETLAGQLGLEIVVGHQEADVSNAITGPAEEAASRRHVSEERSRAARYEFLRRASDQFGARYVATAHTADDQVETILHNIIRGTGLAGLAGIPRHRGLSEGATLVRPLLEISRQQVLDYLASLSQPFREDATNAELHYTRNRIRHVLLPLLEREFNPQIREALLRLSQIAAQEDRLLDDFAQRLLAHEAKLHEIPRGVALTAAPLNDAGAALARRALMAVWRRQSWPLQNMTFARWEELRQLAAANEAAPDVSLKRMLPGAVYAEKRAGLLRLWQEA